MLAECERLSTILHKGARKEGGSVDDGLVSLTRSGGVGARAWDLSSGSTRLARGRVEFSSYSKSTWFRRSTNLADDRVLPLAIRSTPIKVSPGSELHLRLWIDDKVITKASSRSYSQ